MVRIGLGVITGFFTWIILWVAIEKVLISILPEWYGVPQLAFQMAVENGQGASGFPETRLLLSHLVIGSLVAVFAGFLAALIARENKRAPLILGFLLVGFGLLKVVMSWGYGPIWYQVIFTAILFPMTIMGGKLKSSQVSRNQRHF